MSRSILLIEDEPGLVMTISDLLSADAFSVQSARDGDTGWQWRPIPSST
jgi:DNA-binding response OmpR family regulator